jgi:peptide/nickel transport system substrate-binding protein
MEGDRNTTERNRISQSNLLGAGEAMFRIAKFISIVVLAVAFGVLLVRGDTWSAEKKTGAVKLRTYSNSDPITLDPAKLRHGPDRIIAQNVFQGLVTFDYLAEPPYPIIPVLAKSYEVSRDAKMITFKLHKGVQFHHDYGELTSEDVVFSLQRHLDPKVASWAKSQLADVERIDAPDKYTVRIYLKVPSARSLLGNLAWQNAGFVLNKKAVLKLGDKFGDYWRTPAKIDEIEIWVVPEEIVALGALEKGDLDIASVTESGSARRVKAIKDIDLVQAKGSTSAYHLYLNNKKKPLDDVRVRRALAHALDIKGIIERLGPQFLRYFPSPLPPALFAATDEFWTYEYNLDKARQLLAEAGYPKGFELRMIYKKGRLYEPVALEVQNSWRKVVDVKLELIEKAVFTKTVKQFNHHVAVWSRGRNVPYLFAQVYETDSPVNLSKYSNPKVDEAVKRAKSAATEEEARKYWREFQRLIVGDVANMWIASAGSIAAVSKKVKGIAIIARGVYDLEKAYIE